MGKKKRTQAFVLKPWCWYCEREFEDEKVLLQHQKSKHFKCQLCPRKLNTAGGLMVHSQQVHKCEPEPLTNTLPGRDGYDIEIFGMEGVPTNALAEWKARKEQEAGAAALAAASLAKRPRHAYTVIPEADLMFALEQHKALMAARRNREAAGGAVPPFPPGVAPPFPPGAIRPPLPGMPPPTLGVPPYGAPPFQPPFPPPGGAYPPPPANGYPPAPAPAAAPAPLPAAAPAAPITAEVLPPAGGVFWPDNDATPAEKRALEPKYRYTSPEPEAGEAAAGQKRKAAADFL
ncbi:hypothetical protein VHUM_01047 [Vanrija humicola]|uniref:C2H2-type domain-containing protein n=1 Tax=Vanrija humicola TaxID=5417 RepID=A0A7D8V2C0_VANHU|nr:hypothetical protein VHUM_01047 [Vanrija humicola]